MLVLLLSIGCSYLLFYDKEGRFAADKHPFIVKDESYDKLFAVSLSCHCVIGVRLGGAALGAVYDSSGGFFFGVRFRLGGGAEVHDLSAAVFAAERTCRALLFSASGFDRSVVEYAADRNSARGGRDSAGSGCRSCADGSLLYAPSADGSLLCAPSAGGSLSRSSSELLLFAEQSFNVGRRSLAGRPTDMVGLSLRRSPRHAGPAGCCD